jgi:hypothetical protein
MTAAKRARKARGSPPGADLPAGGTPCSERQRSFYAQLFGSCGQADLEDARSSGLQDEVALLRLLTRRVAASALEVESVDEALEALRVLSLVFSRLAGMLRTQKELDQQGESELAASLSQALAELADELGLQ